jgi:hypothetical protein
LIQLWSFILVSGLVTYIFGFSRALSFNGSTDISDEPAPVASTSPVSSPAES